MVLLLFLRNGVLDFCFPTNPFALKCGKMEPVIWEHYEKFLRNGFFFLHRFLFLPLVIGIDFFFPFWVWGFDDSKTAAKMAVARIKLLRNKREAVVKQMRRDIALLLQSGQDATARIRVILCLQFAHLR